MHDEFEMSMMGELDFFLGLQIKQLEDEIFFNQSKYVKEMLKKFDLEDSKPIKTPMSSKTKLTRDEDGEPIDDTKYRVMIGSLLYLTASLPDIMISIYLCARFQEAPKTSHLEAIKRIFRYIKDYVSTPPPTSPTSIPPLSPIISPATSNRNLLLTSKSTPPPLTSPPPVPTQPLKITSPSAINLDPLNFYSLLLLPLLKPFLTPSENFYPQQLILHHLSHHLTPLSVWQMNHLPFHLLSQPFPLLLRS
uniref:Reverse transcriptase Ty1/copia-type domain-containing protein n=1 Tax=Tanacetum cinerariifolium TaxID=118510 RepID=A0A699IRX6_TANCI|nr:hypothetical protein [Tanacetum cinerariifolium]